MQHYNKIKLINDFPEKGIHFRHIGPLLKDPFAFKEVIQSLIEKLGDAVYQIDVIAGLDARGFIFATAFQWELQKPQIMIRKESKTPGDVVKVEYSREYGKKTVFEIEKDLIKPGQKVLIVDDLLATAGSMMAAADLISHVGGIPFAFVTAIELIGLNGEKNIKGKYPDAIVKSLFAYDVQSESEIPLQRQEITLFKTTQYTQYDHHPVLMYHPTLKSIADTMLQHSNYRESHIEWDAFPDTWSNITFEPSKTLVNKDVTFLMSVATMEIFAEQMCVLIALPRQLIRSLTIVIPYLGPATHERVSYSGMLATVEPMLKMLSSCIPPTKSGPPVIRIFDIHALQIRFYVTDQIVLKLMSAIPLLKKTIPKRTTIVFPDDGAYKRFNYEFSDYPMIICSKVRLGNQRIISIKDKYNWCDEDESLLHHAIIVDDLAQSGGTIYNTAIALRKMGFKRVDAYVTHAVFPRDSYVTFTNEPHMIDTFYVTNTNPCVTKRLENIKPFCVLSIEEHLIHEISASVESVILHPRKSIKNVYVTSTADSKLRAVKNIFPDANVYSVSCCLSCVNEQPIGEEEIVKGCRNRLDSFVSIDDDDDIVIAIENGIIWDNDIPYDVPCIMIRHHKTKIMQNDMKTGRVSLENYRDYIKTIDPSKTFGSYIEKKYGLKNDGWFTYLGNNSRVDILTTEIRNTYYQINDDE